MKRWIALMLLALLLTGCSSPDPAPSTAPGTTGTASATGPSDAVTAPTGESLPEQTVPSQPPLQPEAPTPLTAMSLDGEYLALAPMGSNLLLFAEDQLSLWSFGSAAPSATARISDLPMPDSGLLQILDNAVVYFDAEACAVVYLNEQLQTVKSLQLNEALLGDPCLAADGSKLWFCTAAGIRVWDLETGVSRNLKLQEGNWEGITGTLLDGTALRCQLRQADGTLRTLLISTQTGQTLREGKELNSITGSGQLYCYDSGEEDEGDSERYSEDLYLAEGKSGRAYQRQDHYCLNECMLCKQFGKPVHVSFSCR